MSSDEAVPLQSLSLTHVFYNPEDPISHFCAWLALVPQALCVVYVTLLWASREVEILAMFAGQLACEGLNFLLKRAIKQERPEKMYGKGYGMPSSHAQFITFFAVSLIMFLIMRHRPPLIIFAPCSSTSSEKAGAAKKKNQTHNHGLSPIARVTTSIAVLLLAIAVATSRIYLSYHTPLQVLVGCAAGALSAVLWYYVTDQARHLGLYSFLLSFQLMRWLRWRDLILEEDLACAGWIRFSRRENMGPHDVPSDPDKKVR